MLSKRLSNMYAEICPWYIIDKHAQNYSNDKNIKLYRIGSKEQLLYHLIA